MSDLAERLSYLRGSLEPIQNSGGMISAREVRWLIQELERCSQLAITLEFDRKWAERLLDEITSEAQERERANNPPPAPRPRRLRVIVGGRA